MEKVLIAALLACQPGHRLVDWSDRISRGTFWADILVTVEPLYARLLIYSPGRFETVQRCCQGRQAAMLHIPIEDGRFCIGQSQPQMKWTLRLSLRPSLEL
jgi:hypothetical protein